MFSLKTIISLLFYLFISRVDCDCSLQVQITGAVSSFLVITDPARVEFVSVTDPGSSSCLLKILVVGGGGNGTSGGGGSGYLEYHEQTLLGEMFMAVNVGDVRQETVVTINDEDNQETVRIVGGAGEDGDGYYGDGGDGYSGGGEWSFSHGYSGGRGGGDGEGFSGAGHGQGLELSLLEFDQVRLSPGEGGPAFYYSGDGYYYGGGGGGVLVDGEEPHGDRYQGRGYGGGGCEHLNDDNQLVKQGRPGVVVIEVTSES